MDQTRVAVSSAAVAARHLTRAPQEDQGGVSEAARAVSGQDARDASSTDGDAVLPACPRTQRGNSHDSHASYFGGEPPGRSFNFDMPSIEKAVFDLHFNDSEDEDLPDRPAAVPRAPSKAGIGAGGPPPAATPLRSLPLAPSTTLEAT